MHQPVLSLGRVLWASGAAMALGAGLLAAPAYATSSVTGPASVTPPVPIPLHRASASLTLQGLSEAGAVVWRQTPAGETTGDGVSSLAAQVLTGALGTDLRRRDELVAAEDVSQPVFREVVGASLPWFADREVSGTTVTDLHRFDVSTGTDVVDGTVPRASTADYNGTSWFVVPYVDQDETGRPPGSIDTYPLSSAPQQRNLPWPGHQTLLTLGADRYVGSIDVDADDRAMISYGDNFRSDPPDFSQIVNLVDLATGHRTELKSSSGIVEGIGRVVLSRTTVAWGGASGNLGWSIYSVPRTGGPVDAHYGSGHPGNRHWRTAADTTDDGKVGWIYDLATMMTNRPGTAVRVADAGAAYDLPVPETADGLVGNGDHFYTAIGGSAASAGVWRLDGTKDSDGARTRVATVPAVTRALRGWTFTDGVVTWADHAGGAEDRLSLWRRPVTLGRSGPVLSRERRTAVVARTDPEAPASTAFAADDDRALVSRSDGAWFLTGWKAAYHNAIIPAKIKGLDGRLHPPRNVSPQLTSRWMLIAGQVFATSNQRRVFSEPAAGRRAAQDAIDGNTLVYGTTTTTPGKSPRGEVWTVDLTHPGRRTRLASSPCDHAPAVAVLKSTVAWANCDRSRITVKNLRTGAVHRLIVRETPRDDPWAPWGLQVQELPF